MISYEDIYAMHGDEIKKRAEEALASRNAMYIEGGFPAFLNEFEKMGKGLQFDFNTVLRGLMSVSMQAAFGNTMSEELRQAIHKMSIDFIDSIYGVGK